MRSCPRLARLALLVVVLLAGACGPAAATPTPRPTSPPAPPLAPTDTPTPEPTPRPKSPVGGFPTATDLPTLGPPPPTPAPPDATASPSPAANATAAPSAIPSPGGPDALDQAIGEMSVEDRAGQLLMLSFSGNAASAAEDTIAALKPGGIVLLQNATGADAARAMTHDLQGLSARHRALPLLIAVDQEGGSVQRITEGVTSFGPNWAVGRLPPDQALAEACRRGSTQGQELHDLGIQVNLAPVLDVWDNPLNTVIGQRAFSDNPEIVARLGSAYIEALQAQGVLAVGKHFPGHGSTAEDSHQTLPVVNHDRAWLDAHELVPFRAAIQVGVAGIMLAHVSYPQLDPEEGRPASLSQPIATDLLREQLGYHGLVLTDDLGAMKAITDTHEPGAAAVQAVQAGADMLIVVAPLSTQRAMRDAIVAAVEDGSISKERLNAAVKHVLVAKAQAGLSPGQAPPLVPANPVCPSPAAPPAAIPAPPTPAGG